MVRKIVMHLSGLFSGKQYREVVQYIERLRSMEKNKDHIERTKRMIEVMQAYVDGEEIEGKGYDGYWCSPVTPSWRWDEFDYRVIKTPDSINWDHVAPGFKYMARDADGFAYLHVNKPVINIDYWVNGYKAPVDTQSSYRKGTVDWKESLVIRPGCE